ncbi:Shedu immune nuclease family protein [Pseudomonas citronellolis]|uniref:Shedu immune nuclease family protein n=2 Tax=Pseudomonas citronellolis TaxID=53408 RepID=UPI00209F1519|nr:Shedu immune nuclease family protein [Pseudomonas citronellolis]MCP1725096.1 hypothetical protein [Pseudomonas citronellolis]
MASIRPSQYAMQNRTDGGPFLRVDLADEQGNIVNPGAQSADITLVYFSDVSLPVGSQNWHLIMAVTAEELTFYPKISRSDNDNYGEPRYGNIERIELVDPSLQLDELPYDQHSLEALLSQLPPRFRKDWRFGLGFLYEYRFIPAAIGELDGVDTIRIQASEATGEVKIVGNRYYLGIDEFEELCSRIEKISRRHQRDTAEDKKLVCYSGLLHRVNPELYPARARKLPPDVLKDLVNLGRDKLSNQDQRSATRLVKKNAFSIARNEPRALYELKAEIELVTLGQLIEAYKKMMSRDLSEDHWHQFFTDNAFILDMAFGHPVKMVASKPYVGGKQVSGQGGQHTDFLMAASSTRNLAIIEIKHPQKELVTKSEYRTDVYGPSTELGGSIAQALSQRAFLLQDVLSLTADMDERAYAHAVPIVIIIGRMPSDKKQQRSFEQFRNSLKDIQITTFDELQTRLESIHHALQPEDASKDEDAGSG